MKKSVSFLVPVSSILLIAITVTVVACSKSGGNGKPKISFKSVNTDIPVNGGLDVILNYTDPSNNINNGTFYAVRTRLNQKPLSSTVAPVDTVTGPIPDFKDPGKGELEFTQDYTFLHESDTENDTITFSFAVITPAGVSSDTIVSPKIVIHTP